MAQGHICLEHRLQALGHLHLVSRSLGIVEWVDYF